MRARPRSGLRSHRHGPPHRVLRCSQVARGSQQPVECDIGDRQAIPTARWIPGHRAIGFRPDLGDLHPVLRQCPGLVGADHGRRAECLDGAQALDECVSSGQDADADCEREGDRGQEPFRNVRNQKPDREWEDGIADAKPGGERPEWNGTRVRRRPRPQR